MIPKILGNPRARAVISKAARGEPFHAYIVTGQKGSGKSLAARTLARALVCSELHERPCGRCADCIKAERDKHPDIQTIGMEGKTSFLTDQARALRNDAFVMPNEARRKVYILPDAAYMQPAAQNALLKVLEEPPDYAVFILICENAESLLETVRSRCAQINMEPVEASDVETRLSELFPDTAKSERMNAAKDSGGIIGAAIAALNGEISAEGFAQPIAQALSQADEFALLRACLSLEKLTKDEIRLALSSLTGILRDAAAQKAGGHEPLKAACADISKGLSQRYSLKTLLSIYNEAQSAYERSSLYLAPGNLLGGIAARLYCAATERKHLSATRVTAENSMEELI